MKKMSSLDEYLNDCGSGKLDEIDTAPMPAPRRVLWTRDEDAPCQAGTVGCSIDHTADAGSCETW